MKKLKSVWVISDRHESLGELCAGARSLGENTALLGAGEKGSLLGCDTLFYFGDVSSDRRWTDYIDSMIALAMEKRPCLVLTDGGKNARLAAGRIAAAMGTSAISDVSEVEITESGVQIKRLVYGGAAVLTARIKTETAVLCMSAGAFEAQALSAAAEVIEVPYTAPAAEIKCLELKSVEGAKVNLPAAKRVIGVGRGFSNEEDLELARDLAKAIGAEIGCTRPIAEESKWMPRETYIGVSGVMLKPELYFAIGLSGQVQHTVGINQSGTIIAINKDKEAPIFRYADYGIVGDLRKILPQLSGLLKK